MNSDPTGIVAIFGTPMPGKTIQIINTLADEDGLGSFSYQWQADYEDISGANASTYLLMAADAGKFFSVVVSYTDGLGTQESYASDSVGAVNFLTPENTKAVTTIVPNDLLLGAQPKFVLSGDDADLFKISSKGVLSFVATPDFEVPTDWDANGMYQIRVTMSNAKTLYSVANDVFIGIDFASIKGTSANDTLRGTVGWDTLDGLAGNDKLSGKYGLDTFHISSGTDTITDFNLLGDDVGQEILQVDAGAKVIASLTADAWIATSDSFNWGEAELRTKGLNVDLSEISTGHGWSIVNSGKAATLTGSMFADVLTAGAGADTLIGGDGNDLLIGTKLADVLTGGAGADHFRLNGIKGISTAHIITDFVSGEDRIELDTTVFKTLAKGPLPANALAFGTTAQTASQHLIYDRSTGHLLYDVDGSGKKAAVLVGVFNHDTALNATDLWGV